MLPAAGQGILAVQGRAEEDYSCLEGYCDREAWICGTAERAYVKYLDGGCSSPVAAYGELHGDTLLLRGLYYREEDGTYIKGQLEGNPLRAEELGITLAKRLKESMEKGESS